LIVATGACQSRLPLLLFFWFQLACGYWFTEQFGFDEFRHFYFAASGAFSFAAAVALFFAAFTTFENTGNLIACATPARAGCENWATDESPQLIKPGRYQISKLPSHLPLARLTLFSIP